METEVMFSQQTDVWGTPQWLFDALHKEFGFTLDPCSDGTNAKCERFFSIYDSGLSKDWGTETVFMNPPYSQCEDWMRKAYGAAQEGATVVCLVPARTATRSGVAPLRDEGRDSAAKRPAEVWRGDERRTVPERGDCVSTAHISTGGMGCPCCITCS